MITALCLTIMAASYVLCRYLGHVREADPIKLPANAVYFGRSARKGRDIYVADGKVYIRA